MAPATILTASAVALRQPAPPEGRKAFPLTPAIVFATGNEQFQFNTLTLGTRAPSAVYSAWIDASALTTGKNAYIVTPLQKLVIAGGSQGYYIITSQNPFQMTISADAGLAGTLVVVLYNYNVLETGAEDVPIAATGGSDNNPNQPRGSHINRRNRF